MEFSKVNITILKEDSRKEQNFSFNIHMELARKIVDLFNKKDNEGLQEVLNYFEDVEGNVHQFKLDEIMGFECKL